MRPIPFARANAVVDALRAALAAAGPLPFDRQRAMQLVGEYHSRGKGRGTPSRNFGNAGSWPKAHQSGQECLRRAVDGWGFRKRFTGLTKRQTLEALVAHGKLPLDHAIARVRQMGDGVRTFVVAVLLGLAGGALLPVPSKPAARCPDPVQVVWNPLWSENPHGIGDRPGDKRRLTDAERLAVLEAQLSDPYRSPVFDSELRREIRRLRK